MKKLFSPVYLALFVSCIHATKVSLPPEIEIEKLRLEKRALELAMQVINAKDQCSCLAYSGKELISCMDYADAPHVRQTFSQMTLHARIDYLLSMNLLAYKRFLDAFENEAQWHEAVSTLSPEDQKQLPKTLHEQLIMIRDTWISCATHEVGIYANGSKDPQARDIPAWRNKTLDNYEHMEKKCPLFWQWLDKRFAEQKIKMLYKQRNA